MISLRSDLRRRLLTYFYVNRSARPYVRQLAGELSVDSTNLSRELARLEREGLLRSEIEGRQRYYSINPTYPYLKPVFALLQGSIGIPPMLKEALKRVSGIQAASIYGSVAKDEADARSDIDVLIVGQPDQAQLAAQIRRADFWAGDKLHPIYSQRAGTEAQGGRHIRQRHLEWKANRADWP